MEIKLENALTAGIVIILLSGINVDAETKTTKTINAINIISLPESPPHLFLWLLFGFLLVIFGLFLYTYYPRTKGKRGSDIEQFKKPS